MTTMIQFINRYGIKFDAEWAEHNPHMANQDWPATHWRCTFKIGRRRLSTYFSTGLAHTGNPEAKDVLDCLASDAAGYENAQSFEDWAAEYGYDLDSRKAEKTYHIVKRQADKLRAFLNDARYDELLWHTERE